MVENNGVFKGQLREISRFKNLCIYTPLPVNMSHITTIWLIFSYMYPASFYKAVSSPEIELAEDEAKAVQLAADDPHPIPHISSLFNTGIILKLVCGDDDRKRFDGNLYPHRMICRLVINLKNGNQYFGSGFFISPKCVITSGHCVYVDSWVSSVIVIPGANGNGDERPFGSSVSKVFKSVQGWTINKNRNFDYGAIILPDNTLFNRVQAFFELGMVNKSDFLFNSGYPLEGDKDKEQWGDSGVIKQLTTHRIQYEIDTEGGNSGSPLYIIKDGKPVVVGVHSFGECPNFCVRIDETALEHWTRWSKL